MVFEHGHALVIGVGEYASMARYNIAAAGRDAQAVAEVLRDPARCAYPAAQVTLLQNAQATRAALLGALDDLSTSLEPDDTLFLFYVGHGVYGTDGAYTLTTHDTQLVGSQVKPGSGVSETDLLDRLRRLPVRRLLMVFNACHAGELAPSFAVEAESLPSEAPPRQLSEALLSSGEGRITISACRPEQKSWVGGGSLSIFSQALVDGLRGEAPNSRGYISAFGLYEYLFDEVGAAARGLGVTQEPELTVIQGVGPFPVALFRAAVAPGEFDLSEPAPQKAAVRQVSAEKSLRQYQRYSASVTGSGAIAQGQGAMAVGQGGILVNGDLSGNLVIGERNRAEVDKTKRKKPRDKSR